MAWTWFSRIVPKHALGGCSLVCSLALALTGLTSASLSAAGTVLVAEASTGLAFSETEVSAYAVQLREQFLEDLDSRRQRGCANHCDQIARVWALLRPVVQGQQPLSLALPTLKLEIVNCPQVDALSFADGTVVISTAFVSRMRLDDAQLAFVLAHEVAHILLQHERQTLTSAMALMAPAQANRASEVYAEMQERYFLLDNALSLIAHQTELEADEVGLELAALAGVEPGLQLAFMQKLADQGTVQSMVSTHPDAALRLHKLRALLPLAMRLYAVGTGPR